MPRYSAERTKIESITIATEPTIAIVFVIDCVAATSAALELVMKTPPKTASPTLNGCRVTR